MLRRSIFKKKKNIREGQIQKIKDKIYETMVTSHPRNLSRFFYREGLGADEIEMQQINTNQKPPFGGLGVEKNKINTNTNQFTMKTNLVKNLVILLVLAISIQLSAQTQSPQKALSFDGVNDYVSGTTGISTSLTAITIEAWVYHNTLPAGVVQRYVTINPEVAVLRYDGSGTGGTNELHFYIKKSNGSIYSLRVDNVLTTGKWMHIAGTYDGTTMKLYLNGKLLKTATPAGGLYPPTGDFKFSASGAEAFNGKMDEVSVWNYARAEADIREDMYRNAPTANANLKNYWQFNNGSGTTLTDSKGTATGTLNNMTNANWIASTIPFAAGAVYTQTVTYQGSFSFTGTGFKADFVTLSDYETIVASRIDTLPNTSPTGVSTVFNSQYWVVKRFGTSTFTANLTFTLSEDLTATDQSSPSTILLYARPDNSDASWTLLTTATSVNAANNTATFNGITGFSQFIVARECINPTNGGTIAGDQTGCNPFDPAAFTSTALPTGQAGTLEYKWQQSTTSSSAGFSDIAGSDAATYDAGSITQTTWYKRLARVSCKTDWTGAVESNVLQISFYPSTAIGSQSTAGQTQPLNGTFTPITVTATGNNLTYQWYKKTSSSNSGGTSLEANNGAQTNSYTPQVTTAGTLYYYCIVSDQCGTTATSAVSGAFIVDPITSTAPAGSGTAGDPYRIANLNNLYYLSTTPGLWDQGYTYIQTANINAAETRNWDGGQGFIPIGNQSVEFKGHYHGKGNSIDSLYINRPGSGHVAFFGFIVQTPSGGKSSIDSLGLTNVNITGFAHVGGLGGYAIDFNCDHCSVTGGSVTATNSQYASGVGGMFGSTPGYTANNSSISHCFAAVTVSGQDNVGGFVGHTYGGYINQCYSAGLVSGNAGKYVGGFVGYRMCLGNVYSLDSSYYDIQASGQATGAGRNDYPAYNHLQGKTTAEMKTQATYEGWDFSTVWKISGSVNNGYPYFDYPATQISTATVSNIANNTATATGSINHIGALPITAHGFCWNTTGTPTLADAKVNLGATTTSADYSGSINSFNHNTSYYLRAYAIDANDTIYGNVVNFTTTNVPMGVTCMTFSQAIVDIGVSSNRIRIPDNNTLDLTNNYSIEAWINPANRDVISGDCMLIHKGLFTGGSVKGYYLERTTTGNFLGLMFDDMVTADNILTPNMWNHIAAVNDNGTRHIYVNGVEYPLTGTPKTVIANSEPLIIGSGNKAGSYKPFYGKFDEISLWNTALSQSQIREHMHFPLTGTETGLVSYWQFDEGSEGTVSDKMGINNGTIVNGGATYNDDYVVAPDPSPFWLVSTTPFGLGNSNTQVVTATGTNTFTTTGLAMNFTAKTGLDSIVVARIDNFPNINPTGLNAVFDNQYWAVHKYGTGTLTANLTFTISEGFTADDQSVPTKIKLYKRGSMADDSTWVYVASASTVNATTKQATFNGITGFSQYIIARGACGVYIPDANFRAALLANAGINTNGDGEIQCTEAAAYTGGIDVTGGSIADMTGIEAFTNLTELYCADNTITSLNVSGLTSLTKLFCYNNQLTSLDVSTNTALVYLRCYQNQLASLDVSAIGTLLELSCNNNVLTSLDLSANAALKTLNCQNNSLTSLNVKNGHNTSITTFSVPNNPGLSCIQVDDAIYSTSHWLSKDATATYSETCNCIWTGATNTDWNTSNNWTASAKPSSINDVTIPVVTNQPVVSSSAACKNLTLQPKATLRVSSATLAVGGNLALQSDDTGTATLVDNGTLTVTGTTSMQQYLTGTGAGTPNGRFWYVANPVTGATSSTFDAVGSNKMWVYSEPAHAYTEITNNTTELTVGTGYAVRLGANNTVTFTGTGFYNGEKIFNLTRATDTNEKRGYNLIGNPYPSYLDWQQITLPASVMTTIWTRSCSSGGAMGFDTYNSSLAEGARGVSSVGHTVTQYIAPLQAFWVKVAAGYTTASITVNNSLRSLTDVAAPSNNLKAPAIQTQKVLRLQVSNDTNSDETVIAFNANASNDFDSYDSPKMTNDDVAMPELYSLAGDEKVAINGMNNYTLNQQMPLGFTTGASGNFTIKATDIRNFDTKTKIILKDSELNTEQELTAGTTYPFSSGVIDNANRFSILFRTADVATEVDKNANQILFVYKNANNQITIHRNSSQSANITVCNSIGQRLISTSANGTIIVINKQFSPGVYYVTVNSDGSNSTKKVIIN